MGLIFFKKNKQLIFFQIKFLNFFNIFFLKMAATIRFGNNVFQKEKKILLLEQELSQFQASYSLLHSQQASFLQSQASFERQISDLNQKNEVQSLEILNKASILSHLTQEKEQWLNEKGFLLKENDDLKKMNEKLRENLEEMSQKLLFAIDLEARLRQEVLVLEGHNEKFERNIENLKNDLKEKGENIEILEKSMGQKDKFNAILVKEKERLLKTSPFEGLLKEKEKNRNKENIKKENNRPVLFFTTKDKEPNQEIELSKKLKQFENENERLKKQNFELLTRIKNQNKPLK